MPELAEVMTIAHDLREVRKVDRVHIYDADWILSRTLGVNGKLEKQPHVLDRLRRLNGEIRIETLGKGLLLRTDDTDSVEISLGMTGRLITEMSEVDKRHVLFSMETNVGKVYFVDYRKFFLIRNISDLMIEHDSRYSLLRFVDRVTTPHNYSMLPTSRKPKIVELLSEGKYTGIGNYLANEALGRLNMNPFVPFENEIEKYRAQSECRLLALEAFEAGGNTFNGGYIRPTGKAGTFKTKFYGIDKIKKMFRGRPVFSNYSLSGRSKII